MTGTIKKVMNDSGSNYCQMPDGTLICWGLTDWKLTQANSTADISVTFPVEFISDPVVIAGMGSDSTAAEYGYITLATYSRSTTGATFRIFSKASVGRSPRIFWLAIGRWK